MTLPRDFCASSYKNNNSDLKHLDSAEATLHYLIHGHKEQRSFKSTKRKNVLYFSMQWPYYDKSSGGKRLLEILKILNKHCNVYFFANEGPNEKYEKVLKNLGIRCFCYNENIGEKLLQLKSSGLEFYASFFSWWQTEYYLNAVKSVFPGILTVGDSVDVHWLREERGNISASGKKEAEKLFYNSCDVVLAVTDHDRLEIEKECGINNVRVLSNIHKEETSTFCRGNDILFVGGFNHPPNIIAAIRAYDIYRKFKKDTKHECSLYIVGDNPTEEIISLHDGENIFVTGFVEDIRPYFEKAKVLLAPLTWGAGIKGKICEAIMHKVPVLTSNVGIEGFDLNNFEDCFIAENDREFIGALKQIYNLETELVEEITDRAFKKTISLVSQESAEATVKKILYPDPHVVISIATYKNQEILDECLESIRINSNYKNFKIVVTDNAAEKDVEILIQKYKSKNIDIEYVKNEQNKFFSRPHNEVIKRFKKSDIILLNDDVVINTKCWIRVAQNAAYIGGNIACCGGKPIMRDGKLEEAGGMIFNNGYVHTFGNGDDPNKKEYNRRKFVGYCAGSLLYMRRDAIEKVGELDENFKPLYYEDTDWQYRAHLAGLKVIYEPKCVYLHKGRSTTRDKLNEYMDICRKIFVEKYKDYDLEVYGEELKWKL